MQTLLRLLLVQLLLITTSFAQDSLQVFRVSNDQAYFLHDVSLGDDLNLLVKKYNVTLTRLAGLNQVHVQAGLARGSEFKIPILQNNHRKKMIEGNTKPIFYFVKEGDNLKSIARIFNVNQSMLQRWNNMSDNSIRPVQRMLTGWVYCDASVAALTSAKIEQEEEHKTVITKNSHPSGINVDSLRQHVIDSIREAGFDPKKESREFEKAYETQTEGYSLQSESGAAVFYALKMRVKKGIYYAFHNSAAKGTILKITNPANGKEIYAKVLGPIPKLGEYKNALVTISNNAIGELGARDKRMFCTLLYR